MKWLHDICPVCTFGCLHLSPLVFSIVERQPSTVSHWSCWWDTAWASSRHWFPLSLNSWSSIESSSKHWSTPSSSSCTTCSFATSHCFVHTCSPSAQVFSNFCVRLTSCNNCLTWSKTGTEVQQACSKQKTTLQKSAVSAGWFLIPSSLPETGSRATTAILAISEFQKVDQT